LVGQLVEPVEDRGLVDDAELEGCQGIGVTQGGDLLALQPVGAKAFGVDQPMVLEDGRQPLGVDMLSNPPMSRMGRRTLERILDDEPDS
jgi:hypothetical protein